MLRLLLIASTVMVSGILMWRCDAPVCVVWHERMHRLAMNEVRGLKRIPHTIQGT